VPRRPRLGAARRPAGTGLPRHPRGRPRRAAPPARAELRRAARGHLAGVRDRRRDRHGQGERGLSSRPAPLLDDELLALAARLRIADLLAPTGLRQGEHLGGWRGQGLEFDDYRAYAAGDDLRLIDWNAYERLGELIVKTAPAMRTDVISVLLDCSSSMAAGDGSTLRQASRMAAGILATALVHADTARLWLLRDGGADAGEALSGSFAVRPLVDTLEQLEVGGPTDLVGSVRAFRRFAATRGPAILISDLEVPDDQYEALDQVRVLDRGAAVVHVVPPLGGTRLGAAELEDSETGERLLVDVRPELLEALDARVQARRAGWARACESRGMPYAAAPTDVAAGRLLAGALVDAGILAV
jgi:uncharacterized protein (DUF58 family)